MVGAPQKRTKTTKRNILLAAKKLFDFKGFDATSVEEIAEKSEVAKGTVFSHFGDKTSLLIAIRVEKFEELLRNMHDQIENHDKDAPLEFLMKLHIPWLAFFREDKDFARMFLDQAGLRTGPWTNQFLEICTQMETYTVLAFEVLTENRKISTNDHVQLYAMGMQAIFYHVIIGHLRGEVEDANMQEDGFRHLVEIWLRGIGKQ